MALSHARTGGIDTQTAGAIVQGQDNARSPYPAIEAWTATRSDAVVSCLVALVRRYNRRLEIPEALTLVDSIVSASFSNDLDPLLVASVIAAESSFNPRARSHCGAEGLMQLTRPIQPWLGVTNPYDIRQNVSGGCKYLTYLRRRFERIDLILAAYNAGPTRIARLGRVPEIQETIRYVHRVTAMHARLAAEARSKSAVVAGVRTFDPFASA